jgi:hypothetical protein
VKATATRLCCAAMRADRADAAHDENAPADPSGTE